MIFVPTPKDMFLVRELPFKSGQESIRSYSGYIPIRSFQSGDNLENGTASMFFWYFPAQIPLVKSPPLLIWLQGGPGSSSMIGLFYENGPLMFVGGELVRRDESWNRHYSMLYIDNPVGTGFSFVNTFKTTQESYISDLIISDPPEVKYNKCSSPMVEKPHYKDGYCSNQAAVASDMILFLDQFYGIFPELLDSDLYLTGESYAGKYIPAIAYHIGKVNNARKSKETKSTPSGSVIPLKGVAIGDGLVDPITQIQYHATTALALGLVGDNDAKLMGKYANLAAEYICANRWNDSLDARRYLFEIFKRASGNTNYYDIRMRNVPYNRSVMNEFLNQEAVKRALHVPENLHYANDKLVADNLREDIMKSAVWYFPALLNSSLNILLYYGQFDFRDGGYGSTEWINELPWQFRNEYLNSNRTIWSIGIEMAGYVQQHANLRRVDILGCGHLCPQEQPLSTRKMLEEWLIL